SSAEAHAAAPLAGQQAKWIVLLGVGSSDAWNADGAKGRGIVCRTLRNKRQSASLCGIVHCN
ncbi:MAG: hypothetical protein IIT59_04075, partial [Rhodocyclaceae bacterium]|nr:hypothetical protein [Rhodocyclaceae bacterium]